MLNGLSTTSEFNATLFVSNSPAQTEVIRGYLVERRRALLLESAKIERVLIELDRLRTPKGEPVDRQTI